MLPIDNSFLHSSNMKFLYCDSNEKCLSIDNHFLYSSNVEFFTDDHES